MLRTPDHLETVERKMRFANVSNEETLCIWSLCGLDFQAFSCSNSGTQWYTCFFKRVCLGDPALMYLTAGTLGRGKNKQVCWQCSERRQLLLPRRLTLAGEVCESPLPSLVPTSRP